MILVIITAWYVIITNKMLKSSEKSLKEQTRPYVIAFLDLEDLFIKVLIKNFGQRPALNLKVQFTPSLSEIDRLFANKEKFGNHEPILNQNYMPPGFEVKTTLMYSPYYVKNLNLQRNFEVLVCYEDSLKNQYKENYSLDLYQYIYQKKTIEFSDNYRLSEINKQLMDISQTFKIIVKNIRNYRR